MHINEMMAMTLGDGMALYGFDIGLTVAMTMGIISYTGNNLNVNINKTNKVVTFDMIKICYIL